MTTDKTLDMLAAVVGAEAALDEWDAPPSVALIVTQDDGRNELVRFPLSHEFWTQGPVYLLLHGIAGTVREMLPMEMVREMVPDLRHLVGVALFTEAWGLKASADTPIEERKAQQEWAEEHGISGHPDRVEMKVLTAVGRDGIRYVVEHTRGDTQPSGATAGSPDELNGRVMDALQDILDAYVGRFGSAFKRPGATTR